MRHPIQRSISLLFVFFLFISTACSFTNTITQTLKGKPSAQPTETVQIEQPTSSPENTEQPTAGKPTHSTGTPLPPQLTSEPLVEEPAPTRVPTYLDKLDSYKLTFNYKINGKNGTGNEITQSLDVLQEAINPKQSFHIKRSGEDVETETGQKDEEIFVFNDKTYVLNTTDTPCALFYTNQDYLEFATVFLLDNIFPTIDKGELVKKGETINGVVTDHYTLKNLDTYIGTPSSQKGDVWIAQDGGYIVRFTGEADGDYQLSSDSGNGKMTWEYNLSDINKVNDIPFPTVCQESQSTVMDYPIPANATNKESDTGYLAFSSPDNITKLEKFYKDELAKKGWSVVDELNDGATAVITFQKDQKQIQVEITPGDNNLTNVVITDISQ